MEKNFQADDYKFVHQMQGSSLIILYVSLVS